MSSSSNFQEWGDDIDRVEASFSQIDSMLEKILFVKQLHHKQLD